MTRISRLAVNMPGFLFATAMTVLLAAGPALADREKEHAGKERFDKADAPERAIAVIHPTEGNSASGVVHLHRSSPEEVTISAHLEGLEPGRKHGFHIHEYGDCSSADGTSAGDHYNPKGVDHGLPDQDKRHAGDLGNIQADDEGRGDLILTAGNITIAGKHNPVLGRGIIVHRDPDDGSQPVGDAGPRIGCGVIGVASNH